MYLSTDVLSDLTKTIQFLNVDSNLSLSKPLRTVYNSFTFIDQFLTLKSSDIHGPHSDLSPKVAPQPWSLD